MMSVLLVLLLFGVLQVAVYCYARNIIAAAAADAARAAANAGADPRSGAAQAGALVARGLNAATAAQVPCTSRADADPATGLGTVTVQCRGHLKLLLLPLRLPLTIDVSSTVLREGVP